MNFSTNDPIPVPEPTLSALPQVDWQIFRAAAARTVLQTLSPDAPVLLVSLEGLGGVGELGEAAWEAALVKSLLARVTPSVPGVLRGPAGLEMQPAARLAFCNGQELQLTSTEFSMLQELLRQNGAVVSVDGLSRAIWGHDTLGTPNYVEAHISRLRRKLRDAGATRVIETVRGSGYRVRLGRSTPDSMDGVARGPISPTSTAPMRMYDTRDAA